MNQDQQKETIKCIACFKDVKCRVVDGEIYNADQAAIFSSSGNFGSRVLDLTPFTVEVLVCDDCLVEHCEQARAHRKVVIRSSELGNVAAILGKHEGAS